MNQAAADLTPSLAEIEAAASRPDSRSRAIDLAIKALGVGLEDPLVLRLVAEGLEEDGRLQDALGLAARATVLTPVRTEAWTEFSRLLLRLDRRAEAADAADRAVELDADSFAGHSRAAAAQFSLNNFEAAAGHAQRAARLRPQAAEPLSTLAIINVRQRRFAEAREFAQGSLALHPAMPGAEITLARVDLAEDCPAQAISRLEQLLARPDLSADHRAEALNLLGEACHAAGSAGRAFAAFAASHAVKARQANALAQQGESAPDHARMTERYFQAADPTPWRARAGEDRARPAGLLGHAFLVGFPRSGTTLLENALASHPQIVALEETDALARAGSDWLADEPSLDRLARLTRAEADAARKIYWQRVAELLGAPIEGKILVDKMPISTVALPVISKLFPEATILFARRDPRDVVLSCFRRLFGINPVTREFITLEGTARYYDQVMRLAALFEDKLPLWMNVIRHEDLVADFDGCLAKTLDLLGVDWDPAVRDFPGRGIGARTPSATQLARGLNTESIGVWRRYARQMAPVLAILEPWVARFGYEATDPSLIPAGPDPAFAPPRTAIAEALQAGDWKRVFDTVEDAFAKGCRDPLLFRLRGVRAQQEGRPDAAIADFETALEDAPGDTGLLNALGLSLARSGHATEAVCRLDEAIALQPNFAATHFSRGFALEYLGDLVAAARAYERAAELDPRHAQALGALAVLASRRADWPQARAFGERALALQADLPTAAIALAAAELAQGEASRAEQRLRAVIEGSGAVGPHERAAASSALGDVLDQLGRPKEAFPNYQAAAAGFLALHERRFEASGRERSSVLARRLADLFKTEDPSAWRRPVAPSSRADNGGHIFLLGFPRSGTTMLGQALDSHPDAVTLEEHDRLAQATAEFFHDPAALARLAKLDETGATPFREAYWRRVRSGGVRPDGRVFVDKMPMNTLALPIIAKLFPAAKVIYMRRDPRDVVLSCFRRQFVINSTTIEFLTLESTAGLYDATMRLMETYRAMLDLDLHIQSHEALVADFEAELSALASFAGLSFDERMAGFASRASEVATPSSAQLAKGLNAEGVGAWRRYREQLTPVMQILSPWAEKFGYPAD